MKNLVLAALICFLGTTAIANDDYAEFDEVATLDESTTPVPAQPLLEESSDEVEEQVPESMPEYTPEEQDYTLDDEE